MGASTRSKRWGKISPSRASASGKLKLRRYGSCGIPAAATVCAPFWKTGFEASLPARFPPAAAATTTAAGTPATTTATTAVTAAAATATAESAIRFGPRFIHVQRASPHGEPVERGNRLVRLCFVVHYDEGKPARTAGIAIRHNVRAAHLPVLLEQAAHSLFSCLKIEVAHENLLHSFLLLIDAGLIEEETKAGKCSRRSRNSLPDSRKLSNALQIYHARTVRGKWVVGLLGAPTANASVHTSRLSSRRALALEELRARNATWPLNSRISASRAIRPAGEVAA